jgi:cardiolipin synthase (CMP-forming)
MFDLRYIPNLLTSSRILLAFLFPVFYPRYQFEIIAFALITEFLDGYLARLFGWQSLVGQLLDPIADKIFFVCVAVTWIYFGRLAPHEFLMLAARDIGVAFITFNLILKRQWMDPVDARPMFFGKLTTTFQYVAFFALLIDKPFARIAIFICFILGLAAAVQYWNQHRHRFISTS